MKTFIFTLIACICSFFIFSCSKKDNLLTLTGTEASLIDNFPTTEYVMENPGEENPLLFTATWTETLFRMGSNGETVPAAPVTYTLQIDNAGNAFASPKILAATSSLSTKVYTKDFNSFLMDSLHANPGEKKEIELRLLINYGQNLAGQTYSGNIIKLSFTPFSYSDPLQQVYIIGDMNGWDNLNTAGMLPMFKDNSDTKNFTYSFTGYMKAGCFYKFLPAESLGSYKAYCRKEDNVLEYVETSGGALYNETAGYKTITIDLKNLTYSISDYNASGAKEWNFLGFIGSFCNWDNEPGMTQLSADNKHIWSLNLTLVALATGETHAVKFRANKSWDSRWAAIDPDALPFGKTVFLTGSEYDPNIVIRKGGNYRILFNDLTGQYIIITQ